MDIQQKHICKCGSMTYRINSFFPQSVAYVCCGCNQEVELCVCALPVTEGNTIIPDIT